MGGFGSGPGEFREPMAMIVSGDTVAVWDFQLRRLTIFRSDGEVLATTNPTVPATGRGWMYPVARVQSGWLTVRLDYQPDPRPGSFREDSMVIAMVAGESLEGPLQHTILQFPYTRFYPVEMESRTFNLPPLAYRGGDFAISGDGHAYVPAQGTYAVQIFDQSGNLVRRVTRAHTPVPFTAQLIDRYLAAVRAYLGTTGGSSTGERAALLAQAKVPHPPYFPAIGRILVAPDRTMWLERIDVAEDALNLLWSGSPIARLRSGVWDAFDANGRFLATINLGSRFSPMKAENRSLLGILRTEAGVHRVARVRVDFAMN